MTYTMAQANAALDGITDEAGLRALISQLDVSATGNVTVLYSGNINGAYSGFINHATQYATLLRLTVLLSYFL